jgi:hypothetical protein
VISIVISILTEGISHKGGSVISTAQQMGHIHLRGIEQQAACPAWLDTAD